MAILIAQVWKEIIIYLMSTSKAPNGPQKIPFSFNNIYVWRVCIMLSVSNAPLVANICKLLFHMQEGVGSFMSLQWPFLIVRGRSMIS